VTIIKRCILLIQFLTVPDTKNLIMNIQFIKIKVTVRINLKSLTTIVLLVMTFPVTTTHCIPWMEFMFPTLRFGRL